MVDASRHSVVGCTKLTLFCGLDLSSNSLPYYHIRPSRKKGNLLVALT
jgi:hypothetical protein